MATVTKKTQTINGTTSGSGKFKLEVVQKWNDETYITTNQSTVDVNIYLGGTNSQFWFGGDATLVTDCDNQTTRTSTDSYYKPNVGTNWVLMRTETYTVTHNQDGTKTIPVKVTMSTPSSSFSPHSASASGTVELVTIPRGSELSNGTSRLVNGSNIDDGMEIHITKYSETFYDRLTVGYFDMNQQKWLQTLKTVDGIKDGDVLTFTSSELDTLYSTSLPNKVAGIRLYLYSYTDDTYTTVVNEKPSTWIVSGKLNIVEPTFSDFNYADTNTKTKNLTNDNGTTIVRGYSTLRVSIPTSKKAIANTRKTSISHYIINGETQLYSDTNDVVATFSNWYPDNISVYAVDERNISSNVVNKSFVTMSKFIDYTNITKNDNQSYSRGDGASNPDNGVGAFVTLSFSGNWWGNKKFSTSSNAVANTLTATYKYRRSGATDWTTPIDPNLTLTLGKVNSNDTYYTTYSFNSIVKGDQSDNGFDVSQSYDIMVTVNDKLSSVDFTFSVHSGEPAIALYRNKASLGAKYDESLGGTQFWGDTYLNGELLTLQDSEIYDYGDGYIRFVNGIMVCWGSSKTGTLSWTNDSTIWYIRNLTLPDFQQQFSSSPTVLKSIQNMNITSRHIWITGNSAPTVSNPGTYNLATYWNATDTTVTVSYIAFGKWK